MTQILKFGSRGPETELLQLALSRALREVIIKDGIFGNNTRKAVIEFQRRNGLNQDGIVGYYTRNALAPFLYGFRKHYIIRGDTLYRLSEKYGTSIRAIMTANPNADPLNLTVGSEIIIPLAFDVVPTDISFTSHVLYICIEGLRRRYPFIKTGIIGKSTMGRDISVIRIGKGGHEVFYNASHHANEWITTPLLLKFSEDYCKFQAFGVKILPTFENDPFFDVSLYIVPMVNPDGVDLVTGNIVSGSYFTQSKKISERFPAIAFPDGWKANINGIDLNLQYPAGWETAKEYKYAAGYTSPAPRDFVGEYPLQASESISVYNFTRRHDFALTISLHTQGEVIYWKYHDIEPPRGLEIAERFSALSGYSVDTVPDFSGNAGYKDFFIQDYFRPGYTIEVGKGTAPLPITDFDEIYSDIKGILTYGLTANI